MEGELVATIQQHQKRIAHIQLADNPGRNEPGTGEINYPFLFGTSTASATRAGSAVNTGRADDHRGWPRLASATRALSNLTQRRRQAHMKLGFIGLGIMGEPMAGH